MNQTIENKTKLRIDAQELLAKLAAGPASVNAGDKPYRNTIQVTVGI
ncbi:MAG: hypothetical protein SF051_06025 [Elusimicrobiota bacterium]|nr:hypothetical protein [Elusimicrobiota bacterium]